MSQRKSNTFQYWIFFLIHLYDQQCTCIEISCVWYQMKEEKMSFIMKHKVWLKIAWQWRYLTGKPGFLFIGTPNHFWTIAQFSSTDMACAASNSVLCFLKQCCLILVCLISQNNQYAYPYLFQTAEATRYGLVGAVTCGLRWLVFLWGYYHNFSLSHCGKYLF